MQAQIQIPYDKLAELCQQHHIRKLALFGSVLRDDFGPDSDVDVLVEFEPGARMTLFDMVDIQDELGAMLERGIDLATFNGINKYVRESILRSAQTVYESR